MQSAKSLKTAFGGIKLGESAALLLDQVILNLANTFGGGEDVFPFRCAFAEQDGVAFSRFWRPVFAMNGPDSAWVGTNPRYRIRACLQTSAHIELQHDGWLRILRQYLYGALTLDGCELRLVVVVAGLQSRRFELVGGRV